MKPGLAVVLTMVLCLVFGMACSDDASEGEDTGVDGIDVIDDDDAEGSNGVGEEGELTVLTDELTIEQAPPDDRTRSIPDRLRVENGGEGPLVISNVEWVAQPTRLAAYHSGAVSEADSDISCASSSDCSEGAICLSTSGSCRDRGFRDMPVEIEPGQSFSQALAIEAGSGPVECASPPNGGDIPPDYCGEILIESSGGDAVVTIVAEDVGSGVLELPDTFIEFSSAEAGVSQNEEFEVQNAGSMPLEINAIDISTNSQWFEVEPGPAEVSIDAGQAQTFDLEMTPPADVEDAELEFQSQVTFDSSSKIGEPMMTVMVSAAGD